MEMADPRDAPDTAPAAATAPGSQRRSRTPSHARPRPPRTGWTSPCVTDRGCIGVHRSSSRSLPGVRRVRRDRPLPAAIENLARNSFAAFPSGLGDELLGVRLECLRAVRAAEVIHL